MNCLAFPPLQHSPIESGRSGVSKMSSGPIDAKMHSMYSMWMTSQMGTFAKRVSSALNILGGAGVLTLPGLLR